MALTTVAATAFRKTNSPASMRTMPSSILCQRLVCQVCVRSRADSECAMGLSMRRTAASLHTLSGIAISGHRGEPRYWRGEDARADPSDPARTEGDVLALASGTARTLHQ